MLSPTSSRTLRPPTPILPLHDTKAEVIMAAPYTAKWGIMATGGIAEKFVGDLLLDPAGRDVNDVRHDVVAVASSTSADRASAFIKKLGCKADTKAYGSYEELVKDANVDIIYVASPHSEHYANTLLALEHGKAVCCEKPFTINAAQTKHLAKVAREKNVFLMEAVWIRFFPLVIALKKLLHQDRILGKIHRVHADFAMHFDEDPKHRLFNPDLGGGALLDLGIYPLTWIMILLFEDPDNQGTVPTFTSQMLKTPLTGVDAHTTAAFAFEKTRAMGVMTTTVSVGANFLRFSPFFALCSCSHSPLPLFFFLLPQSSRWRATRTEWY